MTQTFDPYHKWLGIPPAEQPPNHYRLLGLTLFESDADVILSAAEQRIAHVRTFQLSQYTEASQRILNQLAGARVCLLKPEEKAAYDRELRDKLSPLGPPGLDRPPLRQASRAPPALSRPARDRPARPAPATAAARPRVSLPPAGTRGRSPPPIKLNFGLRGSIVRKNRHLATLAACVAIALAGAIAFAFNWIRASKREGAGQSPLVVAQAADESAVLVGNVPLNETESALDVASARVGQNLPGEKNPPRSGSAVPPPVLASAPAAPEDSPESSADHPPDETPSPAAPDPPTKPMPPASPPQSPTPTPPTPAGPAPAIAPFRAEQAKQHQEAWAMYLGRSAVVTNSMGIQLVLIPPGEFDMVSPGRIAGAASELPHHVRISKPFYLADCEITQRQYQNVMGTNPSWFSRTGPGKKSVQGMATSRHPVEEVNWFDAIDFCNRMSERENLPAYYSRQQQAVSVLGGCGYRLPTEAEWEFACRAGSTTRWSFGDNERDVPRHAWFATNSGRRTHSVAGRPLNPFGLRDMHGNVNEWCWDWLGDYSATSVNDPTGPTSGAARVLRGGSFFAPTEHVSSAHRYRNKPAFKNQDNGFRVARCLP